MSTPADRLALIKRCFLFNGASPKGLERLAERSMIEHAPKGRLVIATGDEAHTLYVVVEGLIRVWINDAEGRELTVALMEQGDPLGEIALLDGMPRSANASAIEPTTMLTLQRADFLTILDTEPSLARHLVELLCERLRRSTGDFGDMAFLDLRRRLGRKLADLAVSHGRTNGREARFDRRFSQTELGQMLGVTREAVNKQLAALARDGLITVDDGLMTLHDIPRLTTDPMGVS